VGCNPSLRRLVLCPNHRTAACKPDHAPRRGGWAQLPKSAKPMNNDPPDDPQSAAIEQLERFGMVRTAGRSWHLRVWDGQGRPRCLRCHVPGSMMRSTNYRIEARRRPAIIAQAVLGNLGRNRESNVLNTSSSTARRSFGRRWTELEPVERRAEQQVSGRSMASQQSQSVSGSSSRAQRKKSST